MYHPVRMGVRERLREIGDNAPHFGGRTRSQRCQPLAQRSAFDQRHDEVEAAGCLSAGEERHDVGIDAGAR